VNSIQKEAIVGDVGRDMLQISIALENRQADHQTSTVGIEGKINKNPISILIDPGASLSYVSLIIVEKCKLALQKFEKSCLVQSATGKKKGDEFC